MEGLKLVQVAAALTAVAVVVVAVVVVVGVMLLLLLLLLLLMPAVAADDEWVVGDFDDAVVATVGYSTVAITEAIGGLLEQ